LLPMVTVRMVKVADVVPAATVTDAGTVRAKLVLLRVTVAPPVGAAWFIVTVQVVEERGPRLRELQVSDETSTGATRLMVALAELLL
jgi:hypothetical protein